MKNSLIWIDVETTGLNPNDSKLLQIACIVTDTDFNEIVTYERKVYYSDEDVLSIYEQAGEYVQNMHNKTQLWGKLPVEGVELKTIDSELSQIIYQHTKHMKQKPRLAGNSITLDRNFIEVYLPEVYNCLNYRSYDMSSIEGWFELYDPEWTPYTKKLEHDALEDIRESIAQGEYYARKIIGY